MESDMTRTASDKIAEALLDALMTAEADEMQALTVEVREYKAKYPPTWRRIREQPFARKLIDAIEEAIELMDEMNAEALHETHKGI
jgi:hypothetical protein